MNRFFLALLFLIIYNKPARSQSSFTLDLDASMIVYPSLQIKYAHSFEQVQLALYVVPTMVLPLSVKDYICRYGIALNSVSNRQKKTALYFGGALEYMIYRHDMERYRESEYMGRGIFTGPNMGLNTKLSKHLSLNGEWGFRAGYRVILDDYASPGGAYGHHEKLSFYAYPIISFGLTYTLGHFARKI